MADKGSAFGVLRKPFTDRSTANVAGCNSLFNLLVACTRMHVRKLVPQLNRVMITTTSSDNNDMTTSKYEGTKFIILLQAKHAKRV